LVIFVRFLSLAVHDPDSMKVTPRCTSTRDAFLSAFSTTAQPW